jgi:adenosylcobinamide-GDP ribazoletransferase
VGSRDAGSLAAVRGAFGFLSRLPVGRDERAWEAFRTAPWTLPVAGYGLGALLGGVVAVAVSLPVPAPTVALAYLLAVLALTGINHADGVADLGDAAVVHGDPERRREVMDDTTTGVGGTLALGVVLAGLALAGLAFPALGVVRAAGLVVASEVAAKLAMATLVTLGRPAHEGFGAAVAGELGRADLIVPALLALPVVVLPGGVGAAALLAALATGAGLLWWSRRCLGGVTGDVFGAANELARVLALHAALVAWHAGAASPLAVLDSVREVLAWTLW